MREYFILFVINFFMLCNLFMVNNHRTKNEIAINMSSISYIKHNIQDCIDFMEFQNLFPKFVISDSKQVVISKTIPMKTEYKKYLSKSLLSNTGNFLSASFFCSGDYYIAFYDYMEENSFNREFYTHLLFYNKEGIILREIRVLNGQDDPDFIGEWYVNTMSISHLYYGPYIENDSYPVKCKETTYSLKPENPFKKLEERQFDTIKMFVW